MLAVMLLSTLALEMTFDPRLDQLNSSANEVSVAFSGDGREAWVERQNGDWGRSDQLRQLYHFTRSSGEADWAEPRLLSFTGEDADHGDPFFDDATETLYFTSSLTIDGEGLGKTNIWRVERRNGVWQKAEPMPAGINSPGREYSPIRRGERLYFASDREGRGDVYVAEPSAGGWSVKRLGAAINAPDGEWNVWVSSDQKLMLFEASGRKANVSPAGDLYASMKDEDGRWLPGVPLHRLNGAGSELNARVVGDLLVYTSTSAHPSHADLYAVRMDASQVVQQAYRKRIYVANRSSHDLVSIDLSAGAVEHRVAIGPGPHLVSSGPAGLAVAAYGIYPTPHEQPVEEMPGWIRDTGGSVLIIGPAGETRRIDAGCSHPHGTAWNGAGTRLWITCEDRRAVVQVDTAGNPPARRFIDTGRDGAHVVTHAEQRGWLLVAHTVAGGLAIIRPEDERVEFVASGAGSEALWVDEDRDRVWVTVGPSHRVAVVDLDDPGAIETLDPECRFPIDFAADAGGSVWVACVGSSELVAFDPDARTVIDRLPLPAGPLNVESHPSLPILYASLPRRNEVVEISLSGRGITRVFRTGVEPDGIAFFPQDN